MATDKKPTVQEPSRHTEHKKQSSGDKKFDEAIDKFFKKPIVIEPAK